MKRSILFLAAALVLFPLAAHAQSDTLTLDQLKAELREDPMKAGGNHYNYPFETYSVAPAPRGYEVVYISHYGRHGARYVTNSAKYDVVANVLQHGHDKGALTPEGEKYYSDYMAIYPELQFHHGDLTVKGQEQHRKLAGRMMKAYPSLFKKGSWVDARASVSPRAIISMMSFCDEIHKQRPRTEISYCADYSELDVTTLKPLGQDEETATREFYSFFQNQYFGSGLRKATQQIGLDPEAFFLRYFKDMDTVRECGKPESIFSDMAEVAFNIQCLPVEADLSGYFTAEETFQS